MLKEKAKQRSVKSFGQVKHGNISFLLTQEFGSHRHEVALIFRRKPSAIQFTHVEFWWGGGGIPVDEPQVKPLKRKGI